MPASITAYKLYGFNRSNLAFIMQKHFRITPEFQDLLNTYFLRVWDSDYALSLVEDGAIIYEGTKYFCIYKRPITSLKAANKLILSFRAAKPEFNLPAYVLIKQMIEE